MRKLNPEEFKTFLQANRTVKFDIGSRNCPLARWLGEEITIEDMDSFPPWANRFAGVFSERYLYVNGPVPSGKNALKVLREVLV